MSDKQKPSAGEILEQLYRLKRESEHQKHLIEERLKHLEDAIRVITHIESPSDAAQIQSAERQTWRSARGAIPPIEIANVTKTVLLAAKRPMKRGELVKALEAKGVLLLGKDKNKNLGTILWRYSDTFEHINKLGYWVKGYSYTDIPDIENKNP